MKPAKKQNKPDAKKNQVNGMNEKNSAQGIQTFFKCAPKAYVVAEKVEEVKLNDGPKKFYVDILKKKLRNARDEEYVAEDENGNKECYEADGACAVAVDKDKIRSTEAQFESESQCTKSTTECAGCVQKAIERDEWEKKYYEEVAKRKQLKKVYVSQSITVSELYSKYNALLKTSTGTSRQDADDANGVAGAAGEDIFTPNEVKFLNCMALDKKNDCSFIHQCLKFAYKLDQSVLVLKTLKGTAEWVQFTNEGEEIHHDAKSPVTPEKVERIKGLFVERISKCNIDSVDYSQRIKDSYVNKLFAAGIKNLSKKFK